MSDSASPLSLSSPRVRTSLRHAPWTGLLVLAALSCGAVGWSLQQPVALGPGLVAGTGAARMPAQRTTNLPGAGLSRGLIRLDPTRPDALLDSAQLSRLPRDLLRVPLLHDVLREDFVDYYEHGEARLSLAGTLRRIAWEHRLALPEALLADALDAPAQVALWRGPTGKLDYAALVLQRNGIARVLEVLGKVALDDAQLRRVGSLDVDGDAVALYALGYARRHLLFASHGDRLLVLTAPGLLLDAPGRVDAGRARQFAQLLAGTGQAPWAAAPVGLAATPLGKRAGHGIALATGVAGFGYQRFFPGVEAVRFDFSADGSWHTLALVDPARVSGWDSAALWRALPAGAAACASLPLDWSAAGALLDAVAGGQDGTTLATALDPVAAVCWYGKSRLSAPLFIARVRDAGQLAALKPRIGELFARYIGATEAQAGDTGGRLPVNITEQAGTTRWRREVSARYGSAPRQAARHAGQLSAARLFPVTLALGDEVVLFSPDGALVDDALAVEARTWPALADEMPGDTARVIARITPAALATLVGNEAFESLPANRETLFRDAATHYLKPRLDALARYGTLDLVLPARLPATRGWVAVDWVAAPAR